MSATHHGLTRPPQINGENTDLNSSVDTRNIAEDLGNTTVKNQACKIEKDARKFIQTNMTCVLSTLMPDGSPHTSAAHFATDDSSQVFFFCINRNSLTAKNVLRDSRAAIAIGVDDETPTGFQSRGHVTVGHGERRKDAEYAFYGRFPHSSAYKDDSDTVFLQFSPTWVRYSNGKSHKQFFMRGFSPSLLESRGNPDAISPSE